MIKPIFNRYERKYFLTNNQKNEFTEFLKTQMIYDAFSIDGKAYTIYNIYFDTDDFNIIRNSLSKPKYKDKLRLRSYQCPVKANDLVFLEIKKKFEGIVNKRRINLSYQAAIDYLEKGIKPKFDSYIDKQSFDEIDYFIQIHKAKPGAFISYERIAMISENEELRITFDHQMLFRKQNISLAQSGGAPIMADATTWLMEVKSNDNFPLWLAQRLSSFQLYSQGFSKYGTAYKQLILGGTIDDYILYDY